MEHTKQLLTLLPLRLDPIILVQQIPEEVFFVELTHQPVLHNIFAVVNEQVHDRFGNLVSDGFANDVEVRRDEGANEFRLQGFPLCEFGIALGGLRLLVRVEIQQLMEMLLWKGNEDVRTENHSHYSPDLTLQPRNRPDCKLVVWVVLALDAYFPLFGCSG